jgi:hypothetical protein
MRRQRRRFTIGGEVMAIVMGMAMAGIETTQSNDIERHTIGNNSMQRRRRCPLKFPAI